MENNRRFKEMVAKCSVKIMQKRASTRAIFVIFFSVVSNHLSILIAMNLLHRWSLNQVSYDPIILQRIACLVANHFTVGNHAFLSSFTPTGRP